MVPCDYDMQQGEFVKSPKRLVETFAKLMTLFVFQLIKKEREINAE